MTCDIRKQSIESRIQIANKRMNEGNPSSISGFPLPINGPITAVHTGTDMHDVPLPPDTMIEDVDYDTGHSRAGL